MSEYQYYEFLAIDRPLTADELDELRALSTRATITPVSFTNEYNWGDFKGNPGKLMQRYFDAHVYVANWMTAIFMVRLPIEALTRETAKAVAVPYLLDIKATKTHWIITWSLEESENYDRFGMEDGRGWMARLAPVRDELLRGDLRSLYIGWLPAVAGEMMDDDEMEPLSVRRIGKPDGELSRRWPNFSRWTRTCWPVPAWAVRLRRRRKFHNGKWKSGSMPCQEKKVNSILKQLLEGKGQQAERSIRNRFASWRRGLQTGDTDAPRRTVGELRQNAEKARLIRMEKQKRDQKQREIKRREKRKAYLKNLSSDFPKVWASVKEPVERGSGRGYNEACRILVDIAEAYDFVCDKESISETN